MSQSDVLDWLVNRRLSGDDSYFLPKEITKGLKDNGLTNGALCGVRGDCFRLWQQGNGCLEMFDQDRKGMTNWLKCFRVKKEYCKVMDHGKKN
jgi:hypothetical protein